MSQRRRPLRIGPAACLLVGVTAVQAAGAPRPAQAFDRYEFTQVHMAVDVKLIVYAPNPSAANTAAHAAYARIAELNNRLSDYDPNSELSRLAATAGTGQAVPVSDDLWRVVVAAQDMSSRSGGAFDVTVGPAVRLWRRARRDQQLPSPARLAEALTAVGHEHLKLHPDKRTVTLKRPGMRLDLGGIAKGYAADEALAVLRAHGCPAALVGLAGDIAVGDPPPGEQSWTVAIEPLAADEGSPPRRLRLIRQAVSTSGDTAQYVEIDGIRYSHILDPKTGLGLTRRGSVTVVAPTCTTADALASAACVLGSEEGLKLIDSTPGAAGRFQFVTDEQGVRIVETRNWGQYAESTQ